MKSTTHLPTDETKEILSRLKQTARHLSDLGDAKSSYEVLDKILERVYSVAVIPFWYAVGKEESTMKRYIEVYLGGRKSSSI